MFAVAICALGASGDEEARALATDLGGVVYETRLKLAQPPPIVVLRTPDEAAATALARKLEARGHDAVVLDEDAAPEPFVVRGFRLGESSFDTDAGSLPYGDVLAFVRAVLTPKTETVSRVSERKLRPAAAIVSGGIVLTKKVTREEKHVFHDREDLLYVFQSAGGAPWLVSEHGAVYASLEGVAPTQRQNFLRVAAELRARAPSAAWDERLLAVRGEADRAVLDLRAQAIAIAIARKQGYR